MTSSPRREAGPIVIMKTDQSGASRETVGCCWQVPPVQQGKVGTHNIKQIIYSWGQLLYLIYCPLNWATAGCCFLFNFSTFYNFSLSSFYGIKIKILCLKKKVVNHYLIVIDSPLRRIGRRRNALHFCESSDGLIAQDVYSQSSISTFQTQPFWWTVLKFLHSFIFEIKF